MSDRTKKQKARPPEEELAAMIAYDNRKTKKNEDRTTEQELAAMIAYDNRKWLPIIFSYERTCLPSARSWILFFSGWALIIFFAFSYLPVSDALERVHEYLHIDYLKSKDAQGFYQVANLCMAAIGAAIGFLLVFRNNSAYDRYYEGRKYLESLVGACSGFMRLVVVNTSKKTAADIGRLLRAYSYAFEMRFKDNGAKNQELSKKLKKKLEKETAELLKEMNELLTESERKVVEAAKRKKENPTDKYTHDDMRPLVIASLISKQIGEVLSSKESNPGMFTSFESKIHDILLSSNSCDRIRNTPIPYCHSAHIKQLLVIYLFLLPLQVVPASGVWGVLLCSFASFAFIGIEEISVEIEDPFGCDKNDLSITQFCKRIRRECKTLNETLGGYEPELEKSEVK